MVNGTDEDEGSANGDSDGSRETDDAPDGCSRADRLYDLSLTRPVAVSLVVLLVVSVVRVGDVFVLRLTDVPEPLLFSKVVGLLIVLGYLWLVGRPTSSIGFHRDNLVPAVVIGGLVFAVLFVIGYGAQLYLLAAGGESPELVFGAVDPTSGSVAGALFTAILVVGIIVNSFMEESLFRGVVLTHVMRRTTFWRANAVQAVLFGLWHLVFPLYDVLTGRATTVAAASEAVQLMLLTTSAGVVFGYLFYRTNSLWTPWLAHTMDNAVLNVFHIRTVAGLDAELGVVMLASLLGFPVVFVSAWALGTHYDIPRLKPWGVSEPHG